MTRTAQARRGDSAQRVRDLLDESDGLSDRQLLEAFAQRDDQEAFRRLVDRHGPLVMSVCRQVLHDAHDAEEAFQATWLVLSRKAGSVRWNDSIAGWLHEVATRSARKLLTQRSRRQTRERQLGAREVSPARTTEEALASDLHIELARLPTKYRSVLVLCYLQGHTNTEAAQALGYPVGSISRLVSRGLELLRSRLHSKGYALVAGSLVSLMGGQLASASVPVALSAKTLQGAIALTQSATLGKVVSATVALLVEGVLRDMSIKKLKFVFGLGLFLTLFTTGVTLLALRTFAAQPIRNPGSPRVNEKAPRPRPQPGRARRFASELPLAVWQIVPDEVHPKKLGSTGPGFTQPVVIPAGADWYIQPLALGGMPIPPRGRGFGGFGGVGAVPGGQGALGFQGAPPANQGGFQGAQLGNRGGFPGIAPGNRGGITPGFRIGGALGVRGGAPVQPGRGLPGAGFGGSLTGEPLKHLINEMKKKRIPGIRIVQMGFGDKELEQLTAVEGLRTLMLYQTRVSDAGIAKLSSFTKLERLELTTSPFLTGKGLKVIQELPRLRDLRLGGSGITNEDITPITESKRLETLRLSWTGIDKVGLGKLKSLESLSTLELQGTDIGDNEMSALVDLTGLTTVRLHQTSVSDEGLKTISGLDKLTRLGIDQFWGWDEPHIQGQMKPLGKDTAFQLMFTRIQMTADGKSVQTPPLRITDEGLKALKDSKNLTHLRLAGTFGDSATTSLAELKGLLALDLHSPKITNESAQSLKSLTELRNLDLRGTQITYEALNHLRILVKLSRLGANLYPRDPKYRAKLKYYKRMLPRTTIEPLGPNSVIFTGGFGGIGAPDFGGPGIGGLK